MKKDSPKPAASNAKDEQLAQNTAPDSTSPLTTNQGQRISTDKDSLRVGKRGPTLLEDFILREKLTHFDHERIPERVVHARGSAAHGYFELHTSLAQYTTALVLSEVGKQTPAFVRFSTVAGSRGSADTPRDVRGFAVKIYTDEGNWDIVGNNIPVFFIQDAIKFPDLVHAVKPEPNNEIPQAASAHDTFFDFISLTPESMHMLMWQMSDRTLPRYFNTMDGFGVHTFRLINEKGESTFVKYHWKPVLGAHSMVWDESAKLIGADPDFQRRHMWETIAEGGTLEWELAVQLLPEADEMKYDFDILDATKIWPEDLLPLQRVGKLVLNRNPENFFAETEQVAFMTTNIVPGMDFTNDPLLQGRNFSYLDTQLLRLGGPNFHELPINRPVCPFHNNQRDAPMRHTINTGRVAYTPSALDGHNPGEERPGGGFNSYGQNVEGPKQRERSESFNDHYGQARLFWNSLTAVERAHIVKALQFELSKCDTRDVRTRMIEQLHRINEILAAQVARALGEDAPAIAKSVKPSGTADSPEEIALLENATSQTSASGGLQKASGLSQIEGQPQLAKGRSIAILVTAGSKAKCVETMQKNLAAQGAKGVVIGPHLGQVEGDGGAIEPLKTYANAHSVQFDAVYVPCGGAALVENPDAMTFVAESFKHGKAIAATGDAVELIAAAQLPSKEGVIEDEKGNAQSVSDAFLQAIAAHRFTNRAVDKVKA